MWLFTSTDKTIDNTEVLFLLVINNSYLLTSIHDICIFVKVHLKGNLNNYIYSSFTLTSNIKKDSESYVFLNWVTKGLILKRFLFYVYLFIVSYSV